MSFVKMDSGQKNIDILSSMLTRLHNLDLITNDEKLKLIGQGVCNDTKIALFDMLTEKDSVAASKMFLAIRAVKLENDESSNSGNIIRDPIQNRIVYISLGWAVMMFGVRVKWSELLTTCTQKSGWGWCCSYLTKDSDSKAIKNVLGFLNLKDVKNCRLINKTWNSVAGPLLTKRSDIVFGVDVKEDNIEPIRTPAKFLQTYAGSSIRQSFDSFRFERGINFHLSDLKTFFAQQKKTIKELTFEKITLIDDRGHKLEDYDINDWLAGTSLTKLYIFRYDFYASTKLTLSLDKLHSASDINLISCKVEVPSGCRISPISVAIWNVIWQIENETNIDKVSLNNFIDFENAERVKIILDIPGSHLRFDISECLHLNILILLERVIVENWNRAKGFVNTVVMKGIPFLEKNEMKIAQLSFQNSSIDLFALPREIEKLGLYGELTTVSCTQPITLPYLTRISCKIQAEMLMNFANCANLVDINFHEPADEDTVLNTNWISKSVKRIKMEKVKVVGPILNLETLVLGCSLSDANKILKIIKPKVLVLYWQKNFETNDSVLDFLKQFKDLILYMGPFYWEGERDSDGEGCPKYETSKLATYVDKKATHYAFKNYRGEGIESKEFNAIFNVY